MWFNTEDVERHEQTYPYLLYEKVPNESDPLHLAARDSERYQSPVKAAAEHLCQQWLLEKGYLTAEEGREASCANESDEPPTTAAHRPGPAPNAALWENSVSAAFELWAEIIKGEKNKWKQKEFEDAFIKKCPSKEYHTKVLALAWSKLPDEFKKGSGRPKKNIKNIREFSPKQR